MLVWTSWNSPGYFLEKEKLIILQVLKFYTYIHFTLRQKSCFQYIQNLLCYRLSWCDNNFLCFLFIHPDMFLLYFQFLSSKIQTGFNSDFGYVRCKKLTSARKQMFLLRAPKVLVIQLKVIDPQSFWCFVLDKNLFLFFAHG